MPRPRSAKQLASAVKAIWDAADTEGRDLTFSERAEVEELLANAEKQKEIESVSAKLGGDFAVRADGASSLSYGGPGDRFIESQGYKQVADAGNRGQQWSSGPIEVGDLHLSAKGT